MASTPPRALLMIRMAMITGIVMFAVVLFVLRRNGSLPPAAPAESLARLHMATLVACAAAVVALVVLRVRFDGVVAERRATIIIVAWVIGEFAALFGLAFYSLSGVEGAAAPGLLAFVLALVFFPAARRT